MKCIESSVELFTAYIKKYLNVTREREIRLYGASQPGSHLVYTLPHNP